MEMNIIKVWVDSEYVNIQDSEGVILKESISDYPRLRYATEQQLQNFEFDNIGIHWEDIDEDLSFEGFTYPKDKSNSVATVLGNFSVLNISMLAKRMNIPQSVFASYLCGVKTPSEKRKKEIEAALHDLGAELLSVRL